MASEIAAGGGDGAGPGDSSPQAGADPALPAAPAAEAAATAPAAAAPVVGQDGVELAPLVLPEDLGAMQMHNLDPGPVDYLVKCTAGCFAGRFAHLNRGSGELFGTDLGGPEVTMCIEEAGLSDQHARIIFDPESFQYSLADAGSADGTWVAARWRRSVEISAGQELQAGDAPAVEIVRGPDIPEEEEVWHWLAAYRLGHLRAELADHGLKSLADLRARVQEGMDMSLLSVGEAEDQPLLSAALRELERMFPPGGYTRHMLKFVLRPKDPDAGRVEIGRVAWSGGLLSLAPDGGSGQGPDAEAESEVGVVPGTGWRRWERVQVGFTLGRYYVHSRTHQANEGPERCFVRLGAGQRHWLQPADVFRIGALEFQVLRFNVGAHSAQGYRPTMEDEEISLQDLTVSYLRHASLFGVYDGHGGRECARFARQHLHLNLVEAMTSAGKLDESSQVLHDIHAGLSACFLETDRRWCQQAKERREKESGSTAVVVCVIGDQVWCANAGDSRAVLCREGRAVQLSLDHKPTRPDELARIQAAGGFVSGGRVMGRLAVARALGNVDCKASLYDGAAVLIPADPEVRSLTLALEDEFMVLACDGLWDVFSSQEAVSFVHERLAALPPGDQDPEETARALVREAIEVRGSKDNVTVMVVTFKRAIRPLDTEGR